MNDSSTCLTGGERRQGDDDVQAWIEAARRGDRGAVDRLCRHFQPALRRTVERGMRSICRRWVEPDDVVQLALAAVLGRPERLPADADEELIAKRLRRIARWRIYDEVRRHRDDLGESHAKFAGGDPWAGAREARGPSSEVTTEDSGNWLCGLIDRLPPRYADVLRLRTLEGLKYAEIGRRLGIEPDAARMRFRRAVDELRARLRNESSELF